MAKGISDARHENIASATREGRKILLQTKSWRTTRAHLNEWIKLTYALGYHTRKDYIENVYSRLLKDTDPEVKEAIENDN